MFQPRATECQSEAAADWLKGFWSRQADTEQISFISCSRRLNCEIKVKGSVGATRGGFHQAEKHQRNNGAAVGGRGAGSALTTKDLQPPAALGYR